MKVIFLDIDGVLNSAGYRKGRGLDYFSDVIDSERLIFLKHIVDATDAKIILSSSWRKYWMENLRHTDRMGRYIDNALASVGLSVHGKIPVLADATRNEEIRLWLKKKTYIDGYVILDDRDQGWSPSLRRHFVQTDDAAKGLDAESAELAIHVLNGQLLPVPKERLRDSLRRLLRKQKAFDD